MTFTPTVPLSEVVHVPQAHDITEYHIHTHTVHTDPNAPASLTVQIAWSRGFRGPSDEYIVVKMNESVFEGAVAVAAITAMVVPGNTRYDETKKALWDLLVNNQEGIPDPDKIPAGVVT